MRNAAQIYQTVATRTSSQRDLEADLLLRAALRMTEQFLFTRN